MHFTKINKSTDNELTPFLQEQLVFVFLRLSYLNKQVQSTGYTDMIQSTASNAINTCLVSRTVRLSASANSEDS